MKDHIWITMMFFVLLVVCVTLFGTVQTVQAETYGGRCGEDVYWNYDSETDVLVISGNGAMTSAPWKDHKDIHTYEDCYVYEMKVIIEKGVTSVFKNAFSFMDLYEAVIGPDVVEIGEGAFEDCVRVQFSDSVKKIGKYAFRDARIKGIDLKNVEEIGERAFEKCNLLEKVVFGENLRTISKGAFAECLNLKEIEFRGGTPKIAKTAFKEDRFLKKIINHSNVNIPIQNLDKDLFWYQDGKKVTSVASGKTAKSKGRLFRVKYKDLQGKIQGKLPKSYRYTEEKELPTKGKRKGYFFYGWSMDGMWLSALDNLRGNLTLRPIWIKYNISKLNHKKRVFHFEISKNYQYFDGSMGQIRYSENRNMKKSKKEVDSSPWKGSMTLKGLKKGKKYYVQFRTVEEDYETPWSNPIVIQN